MLNVFPQDSTSMTLTTSVWIGVLVVTLLNLRLGWTLSGLVVPGYLVPLLIIKPVSVAAIVVEAIVTYSIVWLLSERFNQAKYWSSFFGRDRFFAIVLVSVLVRVAFHTWIWPALGEWVNGRFQLALDHQDHLHSYGLIIVSLIANYLWKPGILRGLPPLATTVAITYCIIRYGLVATTNINLGGLHYLYEDIASSLLASPKAYIVLLITAAVASRMNLRYSWEFSGILIPSLLALQLHEPAKIVASLLEAIFILIAATWLLKLPLWKQTTMAGARKLLFFFTLSFLYRLMLAHWLPLFVPRVKVTDVFGYGYLLSTLIAIRFHDRSEVLKILRATVQVTFLGGLAGSLVGFTLMTLSGHWLPAATSESAMSAPLRVTDANFIDVLRSNKILLYQTVARDTYLSPSRSELSAFHLGLAHLKVYRESREPTSLQSAVEAFRQAQFAVELLRQRYVYLRESNDPCGWGQFLLDTGPSNGPLIEIPAPLDEELTFEAGLLLMQELGANGLAVAGAKRTMADDGSSDVLTSPVTMYSQFVKMFGAGNSLQVRGHTHDSVRTLFGVPRTTLDKQVDERHPTLWIKRDVPRDVNLKQLRDLVGPMEIRWNSSSLPNQPRDMMWSGHAELHLSQRTRQKLLTHMVISAMPANGETKVHQVEGLLSQWLLEQKERIARAGSNVFTPPRLDELLYLDQEVISPLVDVAYNSKAAEITSLDAPQADRLHAIALAAHQVGYELIVFRDSTSGESVIVLSEQLPWSRYWGFFVFRVGSTSLPYAIEVPRPVFERFTAEFGIAFFQQTNAASLFVAGAHPRANRDGTTDVSRRTNKVTFFNLAHQVFLRETERRAVVVQVRAIQDPVRTDVVVATDDGSTRMADLSHLKASVLERIEGNGFTYQFAAGQPETAGYELGNTAQAATMPLSAGMEMLTLWLSPSLRTAFRQQDENRLLQAQMKTMGIGTLRTSLKQHLLSMSRLPRAAATDATLVQTVDDYLRSQDIVALERLKLTAHTLTMLIDPGTQSAFLLVETDDTSLPMVVNLSAPLQLESRSVIGNGLDNLAIDEFINTRAALLELRANP